MKLFAKTIGVILALIGIAVSYFTVNLCFDNLNSLPRLLMPVQEAIDTANLLMESVATGDYDTAGSLILGKPKLGVDRDPADIAGQLIWEAYSASYEYEMIGDCYATDSGMAQNVRVSFMDVKSATKNLRDRSQALLEDRVAQAKDVDEIYDKNNEYREDFVMDVLKDAVIDALEEDTERITMEFTLNLVYRDGTWMIVSDTNLMTAISGGIVK